MSFVITARTVLQLGAELISSDAVALYELIKNSIDARSDSGVQVDFEIVIRESEYATVMAQVTSKSDVNVLREDLFKRILPSAPAKLEAQFKKIVSSAQTVPQFVEKAAQAYVECNRIVVSDTGHGMSLNDLRTIYLTIGTTSRAAAVRAAIKAGRTDSVYLGEKGVGRLSVMRLGRRVLIETTTVADKKINRLEIDWRRFEEADDKPANSIKIEPTIGGSKERSKASFTRITISDLRTSWSSKKLAEIATDQIARMTDPFSWADRRRFPIRLVFNGAPVDQARTVAQDLLKHAHAHCRGSYEVQPSPKLTVTFTSQLYEGAPTTHEFDLTDLMSMSGLADEGYPSSVLRALGPFDFEFFWFNRQRLRALEGVGDRERVRALIRVWSGICLFRDGYRVLPYGDQGDDWLELDREALASSGYKLNTKQLIGRVRIGRVANPALLDQTNRQGLVETNEKHALISLLNKVISRWWRTYLNEASKVQKRQEVLVYDSAKESAAVSNLESRTSDAIKSIRKQYTGDAALLQEVKDAFIEIREAHAKAIARIETIEEQKERLTQLAGVGLMIEVIAHELTRATEDTETTLRSLKSKNLDAGTKAALKVLGEQVKVIHKRLQTLEPLSITARQRRSQLNVFNIAKYVLEAHATQFRRHGIDARITPDSDSRAEAFAIEGHIVQILENLINNSVYWLDLQKKEHPSFEPTISIKVVAEPPRIFFEDNGPGIPFARAEAVFDAFYSTKGGSVSRRQGLGLYIARQNAELLGGALSLIDESRIRSGRLNTFELELKEQSK
jgi:signal transduction histidine kinase